jgi:hypothetical protein
MFLSWATHSEICLFLFLWDVPWKYWQADAGDGGRMRGRTTRFIMQDSSEPEYSRRLSTLGTACFDTRNHRLGWSLKLAIIWKIVGLISEAFWHILATFSLSLWTRMTFTQPRHAHSKFYSKINERFLLNIIYLLREQSIMYVTFL